MPKQIIIAEQHRLAAVFEGDQIQELVVATGSHQVGDIYLGSVENVLPGIDAAFVNIGDSQRNGFIHVTDLGPLRLKRAAGTITELLVPQQKVLVQVMKEPTGSKGPRLTGNITLPGRYLVLMPYGRGVNLSRRITGSHERSRLRALAILIKPAGMGLLVRTEAAEMAEEAIMDDLEELLHRWESILAEASSASAPALLGRDDDFIVRVLRDMYTSDVNRIVVDSHTGLKRVKQQILTWNGGKTPPGILLDHHRERAPILEYFRVSAAIREALKPRVDLPSGGYVIIEPTEALTVIDVNSGSFTSSATARETVLWTNCEAATEIARQLRLRNIAGVIVVDFIDMDSRKDQLRVLQHFEEALLADKARPQVAQLSELGLVELTRKRQGQNIYELFGRTCKTCNGLGHLAALPGDAEDPPMALVDRSYPGIVRETSSSSDRYDWEEEEASPARPQRITGVSTRQGFSGEGEYGSGSETGGDASLDRYDRPPGGRSPSERFRSPGDLNPSEIPRNFPERGRQEVIGAGIKPTPALEDPLSRRTRRRRIDPFRPESDLHKGDGPGFGETEMLRDEPITPDFTDSHPYRIATEGRSEGGTRKDYWDNKPTAARKRLGSRGVEGPPEVITVPMTPEEQDVYALMGISPLVLLPDGEVRNNKSVVIQVIDSDQPDRSSLGQDFEDDLVLEGLGSEDSDGEEKTTVSSVSEVLVAHPFPQMAAPARGDSPLGWVGQAEEEGTTTDAMLDNSLGDLLSSEKERSALEPGEKEAEEINSEEEEIDTRRRRRRRSSVPEE